MKQSLQANTLFQKHKLNKNKKQKKNQWNERMQKIHEKKFIKKNLIVIDKNIENIGVIKCLKIRFFTKSKKKKRNLEKNLKI